MVRHTLLYFFRLVRRDKSYYFISLFGLTISLAAFFLIALYILNELSFDRFHDKHDRIARVTTHLRLNDVDYDMATVQFPAAAALQSEIPEIMNAIRVFPVDLLEESGDKKFQQHILFADTAFFDVFNFPLIAGDPATAMRNPAGMILTRKTAVRYFGSENPIGKQLISDNQTFEVTAVMEDLPEVSHVRFDAVVPLAWMLNLWKSQSGIEGRENKWFWVGSYTYLLLKSSQDYDRVRMKLPQIVDKYFPERYKKNGRLELQHLDDIHLQSHLEGELDPPGNLMYVELFAAVALVIIIVSGLNLINLSYFKLARRTTEVGIRKFLGLSSRKIVAQITMESVLLGICAFILSLALCQIAYPAFNTLVERKIDPWSGLNPLVFLIGLVLIVSVSVTAVLLPAIRYGSAPSRVLLLGNSSGTGKFRFRNVLMGIQVAFSFILLAFSFIVGEQIRFIRYKDLGFNKDNVVVIHLDQQAGQKFEAFKTELKRLNFVQDVAGSEIPGDAIAGWRFVPEGGSYEKPIMLPFASCDYGFLSTLQVRLLEGVNFNQDEKYDSLPPYLINKRAAVELGWQSDAIGKKMEVFAPGQATIMMKGRVIGVIDDYHFESLHRPVKPLVLTLSPYFPAALIRLSGPANKEAIDDIAKVWKSVSDKPFDYEMLDERLAKLYTNESQLSQVMQFFTFLGLYLTCYGLFAMSSLVFTTRLKEVAIRKVMGANQLNIVRQLSAGYLLFTALAILVAAPIAVYVSNEWLNTFQYRVALGPAMFIRSALVILLAGVLSVSYYLARVAVSNPVKFLRNE
ncbi:MAG: ABC transporter permease [Bacteroidetes bacterium]|nr:ABC transporter permease [Bacteroidota bacterium]